MKKFIVIIGFVLCFSDALSAQDTLVTTNPVVDTTLEVAKKKGFVYRFLKDDYPNPKKAAYLSLVPGLGQVYNKKYWWIKVPVIYGGLGYMYYLADTNTKNYNTYSEAYVAELAGEEHDFSELNVSSSTLKRYRDIYDKRRQQSWIFLSLLYILNSVEAYVSAHLLNFDISEDLSLQLAPAVEATPTGGFAPGVGVRFSLQTKP